MRFPGLFFNKLFLIPSLHHVHDDQNENDEVEGRLAHRRDMADKQLQLRHVATLREEHDAHKKEDEESQHLEHPVPGKEGRDLVGEPDHQEATDDDGRGHYPKFIGQRHCAQDRIKRETSPDGTPFAPLKLATRKAKERKGKIRKILQSEGTLVNTIAAQVQGGGVEIGSNQPYASIHQLGGEAGRGGSAEIPARPYLGLNAEDEDEITGIVEDWLLLGR